MAYRTSKMQTNMKNFYTGWDFIKKVKENQDKVKSDFYSEKKKDEKKDKKIK